MWSHGTATPLQRSEEHTGREFLTDEEVAAVNENARTFAGSERRADLSPERDVGLAYNQPWCDRGSSDGRTSLIVDPSNGRLPPFTLEAQQRMDAHRAGLPKTVRRRPGGPQLVGTVSHARCPKASVGPTTTIFSYSRTPPPGTWRFCTRWSTRPAWYSSTGVHTSTTGSDSGWGDSRGVGRAIRWSSTRPISPTRRASEDRPLACIWIERFTRVDADTLRYEVTVDDPATWTRTWTAALAMPRPTAESTSTRVTRGTTVW